MVRNGQENEEEVKEITWSIHWGTLCLVAGIFFFFLIFNIQFHMFYFLFLIFLLLITWSVHSAAPCLVDLNNIWAVQIGTQRSPHNPSCRRASFYRTILRNIAGKMTHGRSLPKNLEFVQTMLDIHISLQEASPNDWLALIMQEWRSVNGLLLLEYLLFIQNTHILSQNIEFARCQD